MKPHLYVISGASASGKTTLVNHICADADMHAERAPKYSKRRSRIRGDDDVTHVRRVMIGDEIDLAYVLNDERYGISTKRIREQLESGRNSLIILSDLRTVQKLKSLFGQDMKCIYVSSAVDPRELLSVHVKRYKLDLLPEQRQALHDEVSQIENALQRGIWPSVFDYMNRLFDDWRSFIPEAQSADIRAEKIRSFHNRYVDRIAMFDHVVINTKGKKDDMFDQMKNLVRYYGKHPGYRPRKKTPVLFVVAAASGAGKGLLMETLDELIGKDQISTVSKMAKRKRQKGDRRDGMVAIGKKGVFPEEYDFRWRFHQTDQSAGTEYAVSPATIQEGISTGRQQIVISNIDTFEEFRARFGDHVVFVYLHALRPEQEIHDYHYKRWSPEEAKSRMEERRKVLEDYIRDIAKFDHVLLNTAYPEDLFDQMFELIEYYSN